MSNYLTKLTKLKEILRYAMTENIKVQYNTASSSVRISSVNVTKPAVFNFLCNVKY